MLLEAANSVSGTCVPEILEILKYEFRGHRCLTPNFLNPFYLSCFDLQSIQTRVHGTALRRAGAILFSQSMQMPYVP